MPRTETEATPLLGNRGTLSNFSSSFVAHLKAEGEPTWCQSLSFFLGSWMNVFLPFIILSALSHYLDWDAGLQFAFSFIAIMPLAKLLGEATEQLSIKLGSTLGGLLNASFGNAVEIIVGVAALLRGELRIVQTSMLGSILSNLLLVLGMSFFAGGLVRNESRFPKTAAQTSASLMSLACITLILPAAYNAVKTVERYESIHPFYKDHTPGPSDPGYRGLLVISRGTSILLLVVYVAYLIFQLKTHVELFEPPKTTGETQESHAVQNGNQNQGDVENQGGRIIVQEEEEEEVAKMNMASAGVFLLVVTIITSFCADWLVASIETTSEKYSIPKPFIGLILIPLVANAAEHVTAVWMAVKDKMQLTIGISLGSSIQIASFVVPLLVIVGWMIGKDLTLFFDHFETVTLFVSVFLVNLLIQDGKSNYMEGLMLMVLYIVIAIAFWVS